jgi:hypothetical protein
MPFSSSQAGHGFLVYENGVMRFARLIDMIDDWSIRLDLVFVTDENARWGNWHITSRLISVT